MNKLPVSVVISAYNEEKKIVDCIQSVSFADEVIVVDNTSNDNTAELARQHGATVYIKENNLMLNVNKNFGFTKAKNEWVLSVDADERITPELTEEIEKVLKLDESDIDTPHFFESEPEGSVPQSRRPDPLPKGEGNISDNSSPSRETVPAGRQGIKERGMSGFWIPRKNIIFGKWIQHTGWYPDYQLRLFKKTAGKFPEKHVHEMVKIEGEAGYLHHPMIHYNYESIAQFLRKTIIIYTPNEASEKIRNGYTIHYLDAIRFPTQEFLRRFFTQEGYKDGFHGLMLSLLMACYHFFIFAHMWDMKGFKEPENGNVLKDVEKEMKRSSKEFVYWFSSEKLKQTTNPLSKVYFKIKRKLN